MSKATRYIGLAMGIVFLFGLVLSAGCSRDEGTETDREAVKNAAKAPTKTAAPAGAKKGGFAPPPP